MSEPLAAFTSILGTARQAAIAASSRFLETSSSLRPNEVTELLNSRVERDIIKGLKHVIALMYSGEDGLSFFADVIKNISSTNLKIRKLVYTYLVRYADKESSLALLSINAIQKSLNDKDEQVRALSIRVMSDIRISSIYSIVLIGIKKCSSDSSAHVRKAAAVSLIKIYYNYGEESKKEIFEYLKKLLSDNDPDVLSSSILAFKSIFPENYELLHGHFRRYCKSLSLFDEWAQSYIIEIFTNYARRFLPKPVIVDSSSNEGTSIDLPHVYNEIPFPVYDVKLDPDLQLFLDSIKPLVYSDNSAVVLAVSRALFHLMPPKAFKESQVAASLVRILLSSKVETQALVLQHILYMTLHDPTLFIQYEKRFYVFPDDPTPVAQFKIRILSVICNENNIKNIFNELQSYIFGANDPKVAIETLKVLGICSQISSYWSAKILKWLVDQVFAEKFEKETTYESLTIIRYLIQQDQKNNSQIVVKLAKYLNEGTLAEDAKQSVIWLVGEFIASEPTIGPDVLRCLLKTLQQETEPVRYQTIVLAAKVFANDIETYKSDSGDLALENYDFDGRISKMFAYAVSLGRYDDSNDVRDRTRMLQFLLSSPETQLAALMLQVPKPTPIIALKSIISLSKEWTTKDDDLTSLGVEKVIRDYNSPPEWSLKENLPETSVRDEIIVKEVPKHFSQKDNNLRNQLTQPKALNLSSDTSDAKKSYKLQSLDEFFADSGTTKNVNKVIIENSNRLESDSDDDENGSQSSSDSDDDSGSDSDSDDDSDSDSDSDSKEEEEVDDDDDDDDGDEGEEQEENQIQK